MKQNNHSKQQFKKLTMRMLCIFLTLLFTGFTLSAQIVLSSGRYMQGAEIQYVSPPAKIPQNSPILQNTGEMSFLGGNLLSTVPARANIAPLPSEAVKFWNNAMQTGDNRSANPIFSFIFPSSEGINILEANVRYEFSYNENIFSNYLCDGITVDKYDASHRLTGTITIPMELETFGSFFCGETYNYIAFGALNFEESSTKEVLRIVKYDKNFNRLGAVSIHGMNTVIPFDAGTPRFAESGNTLILHTSHKMFKSSDGLNHESNFTIRVNTPTMTATVDRNGLVGSSVDLYTSHSFDQFVLFDGTTPVFLDHGDAYPRSIAIYKNVKNNLVAIPGTIGANCTGVSTGGFEMSGNNYIAAINTIDHSKISRYDSFDMYGLDDQPIELDQRNIVLCVIPRTFNTSTASQKITLEDYANSDKFPSTPKLVKINDDLFAVMWQEFSTDSFEPEDAICVFVDGNGIQTGNALRLENTPLSDCQPIVQNNHIKWYVNDFNWRDNGERIAYSLPLNVDWNNTFIVDYTGNGNGTFANGNIVASSSIAVAGETVTLTINPNRGYQLEEITVYKTGEETTTVTLSGEGNTRTFAMPTYNVTITATFSVTPACDDAEKIVYTIDAKSDWSSGWYGAKLIVKQDGIPIQTITKTTSGTTSVDVPLCLCKDIDFEWKKSYADNGCSFVIKDNGGGIVFQTPAHNTSDENAGCKTYTNNQIVFNTSTDCAECTHDFIIENTDQPATCEEQGRGHYSCAVCGARGNDYVIPATGHIWGEFGEWTITTSATCITEGSRKRTQICQNNPEHTNTNTEIIPIDSDAHDYSVWIINPENTSEEIQVCSLCGEKSGETRPATTIEIIDNNTLAVYPNPTSGILKVVSGKQKVENVDIFDIFGRSAGSVHLRNNIIDISHLPNGVYFIQLNNKRIRFVKQ